MTERIDAHFTETYVDAATVVNEPADVMRNLSFAILRWTFILCRQTVTLQEPTQCYIVSSIQIHVYYPWIYTERWSIVSEIGLETKRNFVTNFLNAGA